MKTVDATTTLKNAEMVVSPGDLYDRFERRLPLDSGETGPLTDFAK
ncbi:MAG: hypothetical protein L0Y45_11700 [Woeseiaceae bacterium]|nr:hypothetical protein [Woeseiaceae bacterium]